MQSAVDPIGRDFVVSHGACIEVEPPFESVLDKHLLRQSEIEQKYRISKTTLHHWLKEQKLTENRAAGGKRVEGANATGT